MTVFQELAESRIPYYLTSFSALDRFFRKKTRENVHLAVGCSLVDLAKLFPDLEFPAVEGVDAAITRDGTRIHLTCRDEPGEKFGRHTFPVLDIVYDPTRDLFLDPHGVYPQLRESSIEMPANPSNPLDVVMYAAILAARYNYRLSGPIPQLTPDVPEPSTELHRTFVRNLFGSDSPWNGLDLLMESGFVERFWPQFVPMNATDQSKGHHPEGNVWVHSLETLRYRKTNDLLLSLSLFLHDCGKPYSQRKGERRFDGHAEIGAGIARTFLGKMGFQAEFIEQVDFLVRYHMVPGALAALPVYRTEKLMSSRLFPILLELYRCDLSSTYRGPDGYYEACKVYRAFLRNVHNPFRGADGKKLVRLYVE
ncbi:MAG TPA: HD domain-containing protein [Spirochaetia bacterium]|nr:HD domain-containing protein [Spirochaetia bacterium]